jgi:hypothetical protein
MLLHEISGMAVVEIRQFAKGRVSVACIDIAGGGIERVEPGRTATAFSGFRFCRIQRLSGETGTACVFTNPQPFDEKPVPRRKPASPPTNSSSR